MLGGRGTHKGPVKKTNAAYDAVAYTPDIALHMGVVHLVAMKAARAIRVEWEELLGCAYQECVDILRIYDPMKSRVSTFLVRYGVPRTVKRHRGESGDYHRSTATGRYTKMAHWRTMGECGKRREEEGDGIEWGFDASLRAWRGTQGEDRELMDRETAQRALAVAEGTLTLEDFELLRGRLCGRTLTELAAEQGVCRERVRQKEAGALDRVYRAVTGEKRTAKISLMALRSMDGVEERRKENARAMKLSGYKAGGRPRKV